jgi:hypothetical protein
MPEKINDKVFFHWKTNKSIKAAGFLGILDAFFG